MRDAFRGSDLFECFVFLKNLAIPHELVKAKLNERTRWCECALVDASGRVASTCGKNCGVLSVVERKNVNSEDAENT